jgi:lipopolysaccharide export LptBFGC system permease protein LptF
MSEVKVQWPWTNGTRLWLNADRGAWTNETWVFSGNVRELLEAGSSQFRPLLQTNILAKPAFIETPEMIKSELIIKEKFDRPTRTHRADISVREILSYLSLHPRPQPARLRFWLDTKLHGRFAVPCTCLIMVVVAIPFGAASGRRNVFVGVAASLSVFFAYFLLQQLGFAFGATGQLPPWVGAWLPNLFFAAAGLWMMAKVR